MATTFLEVKNRAYSHLASGISDSDLSLTVTTGEGAKFPSSYPFHITIEDEILSCTNRSGDTLTVTRAQEGTSAAAHSSGKLVALNITAKYIDDLNTAVNAIENAFDNHDARHKQFGADELNIKDLLLFLPVVYFRDFGDWNGFAETKSGSAWSGGGFASGSMGTGSTINSYVGRVPYEGFWFNKEDPVNHLRISSQFQFYTDTDQMEFWFGYFNSYNTFPTTTCKHAAFRIISTSDGVNAKCYASCGDGTNGTQVEIDSSCAQWWQWVCTLKLTTNAKFYGNTDGRTLKTTITTNMPDDCGLIPGFWIKCTEAVEKALNMWGMRVQQGAD